MLFWLKRTKMEAQEVILMQYHFMMSGWRLSSLTSKETLTSNCSIYKKGWMLVCAPQSLSVQSRPSLKHPVFWFTRKFWPRCSNLVQHINKLMPKIVNKNSWIIVKKTWWLVMIKSGKTSRTKSKISRMEDWYKFSRIIRGVLKLSPIVWKVRLEFHIAKKWPFLIISELISLDHNFLPRFLLLWPRMKEILMISIR